MPGWTMVNGVWREMWGTRSKVTGVVHDNNIYAKINGVTRVIYERGIDVDDIYGFRLVYYRSTTKVHPEFPNLAYNPDVPAVINITGESNQMDMSEKGIIFHYEARDYKEDGVLAYEGKLFATLNDGTLIDVVNCKPDPGSDQRISTGIPALGDAWITNAITSHTITIETRSSYESFGFFTAGWNSMFSTEHNLAEKTSHDKDEHASISRLNSYCIMPEDYRAADFRPVAEIGIARDTYSANNHMIGSHGFLSQSVERIWVDDVMKPFVVELYD